jgi:hypothetical protein
MKHYLNRFLAVSTLFLLSSCAGWLGPRSVELSLPQLQEAMSRKFPFNNRFLELFDIKVANPHLALQPGTNRLVTTMDASISPPFMQTSWKGTFTLSSLLKVDPARRAILLDDPKMENMTIDGLTGPYARQIARAGSLLAEQLLKDMPLYTFGPQDFSYGGMQFLPTKINTTSSGLVVTFEPAR